MPNRLKTVNRVTSAKQHAITRQGSAHCAIVAGQRFEVLEPRRDLLPHRGTAVPEYGVARSQAAQDVEKFAQTSLGRGQHGDVGGSRPGDLTRINVDPHHLDFAGSSPGEPGGREPPPDHEGDIGVAPQPLAGKLVEGKPVVVGKRASPVRGHHDRCAEGLGHGLKVLLGPITPPPTRMSGRLAACRQRAASANDPGSGSGAGRNLAAASGTTGARA